MNQQILIIVQHQDDCLRAAKLMRVLYACGDICTVGQTRVEHRVAFKDGGCIWINSVENWDEDRLRGRHIDKVVFLCKPRDYIIEQVEHCLVFSKEEERIVK